MSKLGDKLLTALREGLAIVKGEADPSTYKVTVYDNGKLRELTVEEKLAAFGGIDKKE